MELSKSYAYREAYSEVYFILLHIEYSDVKKIPKKIINVIRKNRIKNYVVKIDPLIPLQYQEIKKETKAILALLYRKFLADEAKREELEKEFVEKLKRETAQKKEKNKDEKELVEAIEIEEELGNKLIVKKESWIEKILKWLRIK